MTISLTITILLSCILFAIAALHAYWGLGGCWPAQDETSLAKTVVGTKGITQMPSRRACLTVAALIGVVSLWPLVVAGLIPSFWLHWLTSLAGWCFVIVFVGRGIAAYIPFFRRIAPEEPFATLDRKFYAPLCFMLGFGFLFLLVRGFT